jgi:hypothetical protein
MEFLLQLMAELFTGEANPDEVSQITDNQPNEVVESVAANKILAVEAQEEAVAMETNLFGVVQFH